MTSAKSTPKPESVVRPSLDLNITWLIGQIRDGPKFGFNVDRLSKSCHTPRRNSQVDAALSHFREVYTWTSQVRSHYFQLS